jgi:hypothetical protein
MTKAQARIILDLICRGSSPGTCVEPTLYWPRRDNLDNAARRVFRSLEKQGWITPAPGYAGAGFLLTERMFAAYRAWYETTGWKEAEFEGSHLP